MSEKINPNSGIPSIIKLKALPAANPIMKITKAYNAGFLKVELNAPKKYNIACPKSNPICALKM